MSLLSLQRDMRAWLRDAGEDDAARFAPAARGGLAIYQNNYRAQLVACLEESFPATLAWLGGEAFLAACTEHIDAVPPSSWTLDAYPRDLALTLHRLYPNDPEVAELATLEAALGEAFVAADAEPLAADRLASVDWDDAILRFTPSLDVHVLTTNAPAIWAAITEGDVPPAVEPLPEPGALLVWRHDGLSRFRAIDRAELQAILLARAGASFAELCGRMVEEAGEEDGVAVAGGWLGQWIGDGLIVGIDSAGAGAEGAR